MDIEKLDISSMIYEIRGKQVMLDSDLAKLYNCKNGTKEVNQAVKNNIDKFPERFSWKLTDEESKSFLVKNFDQKKETRGGKYKNPRVFTEQGVAMLATIIKSSVATQTSIKIMDAFVSMRHYLSNNFLEQKYINNLVLENNEKIKEHDNSIKLLQELFEEDKEYFFDKEYDAYSKVLDIFKKTKSELIIVDRFTDKSILDMIKNLDCRVILITSEKSKINKLDIEKYNKSYNNLNIYYNDSIHDRYFILDRKEIYLCGSSINYIGYRGSSIIQMNDNNTKNCIIDCVLKIINYSYN